jgi:hypothetical protein
MEDAGLSAVERQRNFIAYLVNNTYGKCLSQRYTMILFYIAVREDDEDLKNWWYIVGLVVNHRDMRDHACL